MAGLSGNQSGRSLRKRMGFASAGPFLYSLRRQKTGGPCRGRSHCFFAKALHGRGFRGSVKLSSKNFRTGLVCPKSFCYMHPRRSDPALPRCGRGGIGRRAALRSLWGNPWKFESSRPHQQNPASAGFLHFGACLEGIGLSRRPYPAIADFTPSTTNCTESAARSTPRRRVRMARPVTPRNRSSRSAIFKTR